MCPPDFLFAIIRAITTRTSVVATMIELIAEAMTTEMTMMLCSIGVWVAAMLEIKKAPKVVLVPDNSVLNNIPFTVAA